MAPERPAAAVIPTISGTGSSTDVQPPEDGQVGRRQLEAGAGALHAGAGAV